MFPVVKTPTCDNPDKTSLERLRKKYFKTQKHVAISCCKMFFQTFRSHCHMWLIFEIPQSHPYQVSKSQTNPYAPDAASSTYCSLKVKDQKRGDIPRFFGNLFSSLIFANMISCCMPLSVAEKDMSWVSKVSNFLFIRVKLCYTVLKLGWILPQDKWRCEEKKCDIC